MKKINCTLWLYTQNSLDFFVLDYDDDTTQTINPYCIFSYFEKWLKFNLEWFFLILKANFVNSFGTSVPQVLSNPQTHSYGKYLLLNSEFQNDTRLTGFQYYGQASGSINITVIILSQLNNFIKNFRQV